MIDALIGVGVALGILAVMFGIAYVLDVRETEPIANKSASENLQEARDLYLRSDVQSMLWWEEQLHRECGIAYIPLPIERALRFPEITSQSYLHKRYDALNKPNYVLIENGQGQTFAILSEARERYDEHEPRLTKHLSCVW